MRDPYLYSDADVLINLLGIKDNTVLRQAEADITNLTMTGIYNQKYDKFNTETLQDIHATIFGQLYDWAGEFRTIQMIKSEDVLGGDTVRYTYPKEIKKEFTAAMKEIGKLRRKDGNDKDIVFRLVRITARIWQIHPFREGNTRCVIVFSILLAKHLGFDVNHELFRKNASYVKNSLVWASQGIYSKYEYLERIFFEAILHDSGETEDNQASQQNYEFIEGYHVKDYKEKPHQYYDEQK